MTDIEKQALALVDEERMKVGDCSLGTPVIAPGLYGASWKALCRVLEIFEAHKREVSDAMEDVDKRLNDAGYSEASYTRLGVRRFIIPDPVDPLVEALNQIMPDVGVTGYNTADANLLRTAMKARGYAFTKIEERG